MEYTRNHKVHEGHNIKRFREMLGIKQEGLALELGEDWNQQKISLLEQKETIDPALLQQISDVLKIPVEAFRNFDEEKAINIISSTFHDSIGVVTNNSPTNLYFTFNPLDKIVELYERMIQQQKEVIEKLEQIIKQK